MGALNRVDLTMIDMMRALDEIHPSPFATQREEAGPTQHFTVPDDLPPSQAQEAPYAQAQEPPPCSTSISIIHPICSTIFLSQ